MKKFMILMVLFTTFLVGCVDKKQDKPVPVITLFGRSTIYLKAQNSWVELGYKAEDWKGKDITSKVLVDSGNLNTNIIGDYTILYTVTDDYGKKSNPTYRYILVAEDFVPEIKLQGDNPLLLEKGGEYVEKGATATNTNGDDISDKIIIDSKGLDTGTIGTYNVYYTVFDFSGTKSVRTRYVIVVHKDTPTIEFIGGGKTEENPFLLEQDTTKTDVPLQKEYLYSKILNSVKAFDLKDGDITYKIKVVETGADAADFDALLTAIKDGSSSTLKINYSISDSDGNTAIASKYIQIIQDNTPPEIMFVGTVNPIIDLEVDVWKINTAEYIAKRNAIEFVVKDNKDTDGEFLTQAAAEGKGMLFSINQDSLMAALTWIDDATAPSRFDRDNPNNNIYDVVFVAQDKAGNKAYLTQKFRLRDTTPPVIGAGGGTKKINYANANIPTVQYRDNSGQIGNCAPAGTYNQEYFDAITRKVGTYEIPYTAYDKFGNQSTTNISVEVLAPVLPNFASNNLDFESDTVTWGSDGTKFRYVYLTTKETRAIQINQTDSGSGLKPLFVTTDYKYSGTKSLIFEGTIDKSNTWSSRCWGAVKNNLSGNFYKDVKYSLTYYYICVNSAKGVKPNNHNHSVAVKDIGSADIATQDLTVTNKGDRSLAGTPSNWEKVTLDFIPTQDNSMVTLFLQTSFNIAEDANGDGNSFLMDNFSVSVKDYPRK